MKTMTQTRISRTSGIRAANRQRGTILFISLVILLLLTIIGVTAMSNVTMEERMAGNLRDSDLSLQAAEAALRVGEDWLRPLTAEPAQCSTLGTACATVWAEGALPDLGYQDATFWAANARTYTNVGGGAVLTGGDTGDTGPQAGGAYVAAAPQFIIHQQKFVRDSNVIGHSSALEGDLYYRVTGHGVGGSASAETVLQTSFTKRF